MDNKEKPFGLIWIIILLFLAVLNDVAEFFFDILDFTGVGLVGEGIMEPIDLILDALFTATFLFKTGFSGPSVIQFIDDILEVLFIPGRTISVGVGIWIANHPQSAISRVAVGVAELEEGGIGGEAGAAEGTSLLAESAEVVQNGENIEQEAEGAVIPRGRPSMQSGPTRGEEEAGLDKQATKQGSQFDELESKEERNPIEVAQEEEFEAPLILDEKTLPEEEEGRKKGKVIAINSQEARERNRLRKIHDIIPLQRDDEGEKAA